MRDRIAGLLLFLPVPIVLALFTRQPLGPWPSLALGLALMATHRLYARPFALARAERRCLWCGGPAAAGPQLEIEEPSGRTPWRSCGDEHAERTRRAVAWASRHARFLAAGILGSIALLVAVTVLAALGRPDFLRPEDAAAAFRLGVAVTVLPFGWSTLRRRPVHDTRGRLPFPVHIQALVGTAWVLWLFRLVGLWWLVAGLAHVVRRLA